MLNKSGNWEQQDPSQWVPRTAMTIKAGMSPGERHRKVANLDMNLQIMMQLMQAGSPLVSPQNLHNLISDRNIAADVLGSDKYFTDPDSPQGQQAMQQMQQQGQQQQQMQQQMTQLQIEAEKMKLQLEQQKVQIDQQKAVWDHEDDQVDNLHQTAELAAKLEIEEAKLVTQIHTSADKGSESNTHGPGYNGGGS